jgi:hypothetical protein
MTVVIKPLAREVPMPSHQRRPNSALATKQSPKPAVSQPEAEQSPNPAGPKTAGMYPELGMTDETASYGDLGVRDMKGGPEGVVLHRTESPTVESTYNAYDDRIDNGQHIGAHYLIGKEGETSLTVPTDEVVYHAKGNNSTHVGIENVGMSSEIDKNSPLRDQVEKLDLTPSMRARLLAMSDRELKRELRDTGYEIHTDITAPQRRANWNLVRALTKEHGLDPVKDVKAHEHINAKTLGEAEPIKEFTDAMVGYPAYLDSLDGLVKQLEGDSNADPEQVTEMSDFLNRQRSALVAVDVDGTAQENTLLMADAMMDNKEGPSAVREAERTRFYNDFWTDHQQLLKYLEGETTE